MTSAGTGRPRRARSAQESLGAIVLGFEVIVVFLGALVVFRLHALPAGAALGGGAVVIVLMLVAIALLRFRIGYWLGWLVQLVVLASGFFVGMLYIVGAIFTAIWAYAMIVGARLDRRNAAYRAAEAASSSESSDSSDSSDASDSSDPTDKENE